MDHIPRMQLPGFILVNSIVAGEGLTIVLWTLSIKHIQFNDTCFKINDNILITESSTTEHL